MAKKKLILFAVALPLFLGAMFSLGLYMKAKGFGTVAGPSITPPNSIDLAAASGPSALLVKESGVVTYKLPDSSEVITLEQNEINVPTGTTIKTGPDTFAHVVFPNNSLMSLSKDTEVVLNYEEKSIKIFQLLGNTWHRVEKVLEGQSYAVETPNTLATVRGTEFNVGILPNSESEVYVMESVVDVSKIVKENGETVVKETQKIEKDKHVFIPPSDTPATMRLVTLPEKKRNTDWFQRNKKLTEKIKEAEAQEEKKETESKKVEDGITLPASPEVIDQIRQKVRKDFMDKIKDDEDLKKIDDQFRSEKPTSPPTKNSRTEEKKDSEKVLGTTTTNNSVGTTTEPTRIPPPTDTPTSTPTDTPKPIIFEVIIVSYVEKRNNDSLLSTIKKLTSSDPQKILNNLPQTVLRTESKEEAINTQRSLEADEAKVEIKTIE